MPLFFEPGPLSCDTSKQRKSSVSTSCEVTLRPLKAVYVPT